jgi:hypothetical protein
MFGVFADWRKKTVDIKQATTTTNATTGVVTEGETVVASGVGINYWTGTSQVTSQIDKFVDQAVGSALLPPSITVDTTMFMEIDGVKHYITGVDDIAGFGDIVVVSWRREHG